MTAPQTDEDFDPAKARSVLSFRASLNPRLWLKGQVRLEVRLRLLRSALAFYRSLDMPRLLVNDVVLTGSNCGFNYTPLSDIDIHLIVDFGRLDCPEMAAELFDAKRLLWNSSHDIEIRGHNVEMYVEDASQPAQSAGAYSILRGRWIHRPSATPPVRHDTAVVAKSRVLATKIDTLLDAHPSTDEINDMIDKLGEMRRSGLMDGGEFSTENLTYKALRSQGYIDRLWDASARVQDRDLSL